MHVTAWNHTRLIYWCECAVLYTKTRHATLFLLGLPKWLTRLSHSGTSVLHPLLFLSLYIGSGLSVRLFHVDVPRSKHPDQKVRFHALGQAACQLPASVDPFDIIPCWVVLLGCLLSIDPQSLSQCRELNTQALVLHLTCNFTRQVIAQGAAICKVQMQHCALALFIPLLDCFQMASQLTKQGSKFVSRFNWSLQSICLSLQSSSTNSLQGRRSKPNQVKFVLTQLHITAGRDVVDASLLALELSFICKAGVGKGNDRKILPIDPISLESDLEVTSLQSKLYNPVGVLQALNCAFGMETTLKFIHAVRKIWPTIAADPGQSSYYTSERNQLRLVSSSECCLGHPHGSCKIFILWETASAVAERTFFDLPNRKAAEDCIYGFLAFACVGEDEVIHMRTHHSGKMLGLAEEIVCRGANLRSHKSSC